MFTLCTLTLNFHAYLIYIYYRKIHRFVWFVKKKWTNKWIKHIFTFNIFYFNTILVIDLKKKLDVSLSFIIWKSIFIWSSRSELKWKKVICMYTLFVFVFYLFSQWKNIYKLRIKYVFFLYNFYYYNIILVSNFRKSSNLL